MAKTPIIRENDELREVAEDLIELHHTHLQRARFLYLETDAKTKCHPHALGPFEKFLSLAGFGGADFALVVPTTWSVMSNAKARAYVDHLLSHVVELIDEDGQATLIVERRHDVEEFQAVLERHGAWHEALVRVARTARQLELPAAPGDLPEELIDRIHDAVAAGAIEGVTSTRRRPAPPEAAG